MTGLGRALAALAILASIALGATACAPACPPGQHLVNEPGNEAITYCISN